MTRFTERERMVIRQAKRAAQRAGVYSQDLNLEARRLQAEAMGHLFGAAVRPLTGLYSRVLQPLRRALARRRTIVELSRLDDRLLQDIGVTRGEIEHVASALAGDTHKPREGLLQRVASALRRSRIRALSIRELSALDDRTLADIGLERGQIVAAVDQALLAEKTRKTGPTPAPQSPVAELVTQMQDRVIRPVRLWNASRVAAGQMARFDRELLDDLGYVKGDVDWVPGVLARRRADAAANRNARSASRAA